MSTALEVPCITHEDASSNKLTFLGTAGEPIEIHEGWEPRVDFHPGEYFDAPDRECPACPLFMFCSTNRDKVQHLDPTKYPMCGTCAATEEVISNGADMHGLLLFIQGKGSDRPIHLSLSPNTFQQVLSLDLVGRFNKCVAQAQVGRNLALLLAPDNKEYEQIPYFTFAVLHFIQGKLQEMGAA